ncbi:MAG: leucine-rich repeat protein [Lachnospiraceae bacterium]|nr:leucine-rich repeat protein [Lachnospiraceae bacterium]
MKGIRYIGIEAFSDCDAITHFKIYTEATNTEPLEIGFGALSNCDKLKKICIYGYASLGDYAMYNCPDFSLIACNSRGSFLSVDGESDVFLTWDQRENAGYLLGIGKGCFAMPSSGADNSETIRICDIAVPDDPAGYIYYGADTELFLENTVFQGLKNGSEIDADMTLEQLKTSCAYSSSIGDFLFANRGSLKKAALVVSSCDLGKARVPMNSFRACKNLDWVYLRGLSYDANLFREVENDSFFVSGIMTYGSEAPGYSKERSCTWSAYTKAAEYICFKSDNILYQTSVPYYIEFPAFYSGHEYLFTLNSEQKLVSCNYIGKLSEDKFVGSDPKDPFTIPKEINGYTISIFVADALTSLKDHIEYLKISDGVGFYSLSFTDYILKGIEIGNGAIRLSNGFFKGCKSLKHVTVSDNLDSIGFNTFLDCPEGLIVTIPGMRTAISKAAFSPDKDVYICTPKDSVAYTITDAYNHENEKIHWIGYDPKLKHSVRFLNDDKQTTIDIQVVNNGTDAVSPNMADKKSSILSPSANFSHWEWKDPATGNVVSGDAAWKNITEDRDIWAVFIEPGSPDKETHTVNFLYDDGQTLIDTQEVEDGADAVSPNMADKKSMILSESANFAYWLWETPTGGVVSGDDALKSISENRDIRAVFVEPETQEKPIHTVNFFYDDGITPIETQEVEDGADAVSPNMADKHSMLLGSSAEFSHWEWHDPVADTVVSGDKALKSISENRDIRAVFVKAPEPGPGPRPDPDEGETGLEIYFAENGLKTISLVYTGDEQLPEVVVKLHGIRLKEGVDYSLKYGNNKNVSTTKKYGKVTISGMGRFCKKHELYFTITPKELGDENGNPAEGIMIAGLSLKTGAKPKPKLFYNGREISKKEYSWFWNQSDDSVSFSAKAGGNYSGSIKAQLLTRLNADEYERYGIKVKLNASYKVFNGRSQTLSEDELLVTDASGLVRLKKDADYTVSYIGDTVNAGKVEFAVCGIGDYHGSVTKSYSIRPAKDAVFLITLVPEEDGSLVYSYKKSGVCPEVVVTTRFDGRVYTLKQGTEYTLRYKGNKQIGNAASCNFRFIGNFKGAKKAKKRFAIKRADLENAQIYVGDMKYTGPGKYRSKPVVIQNGEVVPQGEYQLMYLDGSDSELSGRLTLAPGEERLIRVKVVGKNKKYTGQCGFAEYRIRNNSVLTDISGSKLKLSSRYGAGIIKNVQYNGRPIIFSTDYDKRQADLMLWLKKDYSYMSEEIERHFEVVYADNVEPGKATVLLIPLDSEEYSGICKGTFRIKKKKLQEMK